MRAAFRFLVLVVFVCGTGAAAVFGIRHDLPTSPEAVRDAIRGCGAIAPLIFTAAFVLRPFIFFPSTLLFLAGGLAFGVGWGTTYAAVGATLGAIVGFSISRALGRDFVRQQWGVKMLDPQHTRWGMGLVFLLNLIPIVPMTAINYGAGLSGMEIAPFTAAVAAGLVPRAFAYSFCGQSLLHIRSKEFVYALALLVALVAIPLYVRRWRGKNDVPDDPLRRAPEI